MITCHRPCVSAQPPRIGLPRPWAVPDHRLGIELLSSGGAADHGLPVVWVFAAFPMAVAVSAMIWPAAGSESDCSSGGSLDRLGPGGGEASGLGLLQRVHPLVSARWAAAAHPWAVLGLMALGGPAAVNFHAELTQVFHRDVTHLRVMLKVLVWVEGGVASFLLRVATAELALKRKLSSPV